MSVLYVTGAGVSVDSGIPTFRGEDGFWTIGSHNYTPQEMATRAMYMNDPGQFLLWYYRRFASYRHVAPNAVHGWLADKQLITQNIDGLDGKAGNADYISIHGRLDKVTLLHEQSFSGGGDIALIDAPWEPVAALDQDDDESLTAALLDQFKISSRTKTPEMGVSLKPYVLLFDEFYTDLYRMSEAEHWMDTASAMVFIGTSFSVNITAIALRMGLARRIAIDIVDPSPVDLGVPEITYHAMTAADYIASQASGN
jgi:NAD-dependent deacetylase